MFLAFKLFTQCLYVVGAMPVASVSVASVLKENRSVTIISLED